MLLSGDMVASDFRASETSTFKELKTLSMSGRVRLVMESSTDPRFEPNMAARLFLDLANEHSLSATFC